MAFVAMAFVVVEGCSATSSSPDAAAPTAMEQACDPLTPGPITLGAIVGVGQDSDGTLYVDDANGIFVSSAGSLVRQHVIGTGQVGATHFVFTFMSVSDGGSLSRDLLVDTDGGSAISMALGPEGSGKTQSSSGVATLALVPTSTVAAMPIVNTPNVVRYVGEVADGNVVVATVPLNPPTAPADDPLSDGHLSIFYGPPAAVAQRTITAFQETLSGSGSVTFLAGDTSMVLTFGNVPAPDAGPFGAFALMTLTPAGHAAVAVTLAPSTPIEAPPGLTFTCLP